MSTASDSGSDKILFQKDMAGRNKPVLDEAEFVKMYDNTTSKTLKKPLNSATNDKTQSNQQQHQMETQKKWKIGDECMALYEEDGKWYRAKIEEFSVAKNTCTVSYIGYDQKAILKTTDILSEAEFATFSHLPHQSTDLNWYFYTFQPFLLSEQIPPTKRRRLSFKQPKIGQSQINELYKRSSLIAERFFSSIGLFSTHSTDLSGKFFLETNCYKDKEKDNTASDYSKISNLTVENTSTLNLYLEEVRERLKIITESDVEAADDVVNEHEAEGTSGTTKNVASEKSDVFPIPDLCPPPPPSMFGKIAVAGNEKEALTNMLMSWYMSGYHTGFYQGVMHEKMSRQKPK